MTTDEPISILLSSDASKLSKAIFGVVAKGRLKPSDLGYKVANDIAVRLHLINTYLDSLPPYWIELDVEQLCHSILRDLQAMTQPTKESTSSAVHISLSFFRSSYSQKSPLNPETCLIAYFKTNIEKARDFKVACDNLIGRLTKEENDADELPDSALQQVDIPSTSDDHNDAIFKALQQITQCDPASCEADSVVVSSEVNSQTKRHPARLCLHDLPDSQGSASHNILVLISAIDMALWQEFCLKMYVYIYSTNQSGLHSGRKRIRTIISSDATHELFIASISSWPQVAQR